MDYEVNQKLLTLIEQMIDVLGGTGLPEETKEQITGKKEEKRSQGYDLSELKWGWDDIARTAYKGMAERCFNIGDYLSVTLKTGETLQATIVGMNMEDNPAIEGDTITFMLSPLDGLFEMERNRLTGEYNISFIRQVVLERLYNALPDELRRHIVPVTKVYSFGYDGASHVTDSLFLFSPEEVGFSDCDGGETYPYFKDNEARIMRYPGKNAKPLSWWLRSSTSLGGYKCYQIVDSAGQLGNAKFDDYRAVVAGFVISGGKAE